MIGVEQAIVAGYAAFQREDYDTAREKLTGVQHSQAIHLLGLVEKGAGNYLVAKALLTEAVRLDPKNHEILNNQGLLARLMGELRQARDAFCKALALKPDFRSARLSLGRTLSGLGLYEEAMAELEMLIEVQGNDVAARVAYANAALDANDYDAAHEQIEAVLNADPRHITARYASGVLAFNLGSIEQAETIFTELLGQGHVIAETNHMMARVKLVKGEVLAARKHAEISFKHAPASENFLTLADILWTSGDSGAFEEFVESALVDPGLALNAIGLMRKAGREKEALIALETQPEALQEAAAFQALRSALFLDLGDLGGAIAAGRSAGQGQEDAQGSFDLVRALLSAGEANEALALIKAARVHDPLSQFWLAYETTALRMLGDARYGELIDYERHVRAYQLPVPDGFETLEGFNEAFLTLLDEMNPFDVHPLNQSLRGGGQAPHDLSVSQHPLLKAYFKALHQPVRDYMVNLGISDDHPSSARNTGHYKFSGSWSVRLGGGGHHVNHIHPRGWISSAYYVSVPSETEAGASKAGWLKFGEPPIVTNPVLGPEKWVQPKPGMVVLFPSFLWHGTEPIHDGSVRVTAPFDVVPIKGS